MSDNNDLVREERINFRALLTKPLEEMSRVEIFAGLSLASLVAKALDTRARDWKTFARELVEEEGENITEKTKSLTLGGVEVQVNQPDPSVVVDANVLQALMRSKGMDINRCFATRTVLELNRDSLAQMMLAGDFSDEEIATFTEEKQATPRVTVKRNVLGLKPADLLDSTKL